MQDSVLAEAARFLPASPDSHLYYEEREDLRILIDDGEPLEVRYSAMRGATAQSSGGRRIYQADPSEASVVDLSRALCAETPRSSDPEGDGGPIEAPKGLDPAVSLRSLESVAQRVARGAAGLPLGRLRVRRVEFVQRVQVVLPDGHVKSDIRRGSRIRLEARHRRAPGSGAVVEKAWRVAEDQDAGPLVEGLLTRVLERANSRPAPGGERPIVMAPGVGGVLLHEVVGHALEADVVLSGQSHLARTGGTIASREVEIVDDPNWSRSPWRIDDEGTSSRPTSLVAEGRVVGWVTDARTAEALGIPRTGHGRRSSFSQAVLPRLGCTYLLGGTRSHDDVISSVRDGIYVRRMEAASVDTKRGSCVLFVTDADRILDGGLREPLDPFHLVIGPSALLRIDLIANDLAFDTCVGTCMREAQPLSMSVGAPTFRIGLAKVIP